MASMQKMRLLALRSVFLTETDEKHPLTLQQLQARLRSMGYDCERKTLYDDMEVLTLSGIEILQSKKGCYYTDARPFATAELKLLSDAVASSRFLSPKKSVSLIEKLASLDSNANAGNINRSLLVAGKAKTVNEAVLYTVDSLQEAMQTDRKVHFFYFDWSVEKQKDYHRSHALYEVSPWALVWDDERYYLLGYEAGDAKLRHYRVDKMENVTITDTAREGEEIYRASDPEHYVEKMFGMFASEEKFVTLSVEKDLAGVMIDRFGRDVPFLKDGDRFRMTVKVSASPNFFGWVFGFGGRVRILSPQNVLEKFRDCLEAFSEGVQTP